MGKDEGRVIVMSTLVSKWGNSLALRIPRHFAESLNLHEGTEVELKLSEDCLSVKPKKKRYTLEELCASIKDGNQHDLIDFGKPVGEEIW
ncbi:AbrB/MazE/SpoVT family DNA-binding domain-containing protein [Paenibacillus larvae]|uniref:Antitoxin MazE n=1 Tax=Paenibacillus larvae subsp. larvae TaxID=147375 RepID=A0A6C0QZQ5_9BACL|nr:AbrB/MazE/SpoVT family DNA-binding domain-containing protein [Paenibacillus larvae]QHZ54027.1 Antitoxin MazE [Paenibacillus larvae subsp. larvae]